MDKYLTFISELTAKLGDIQTRLNEKKRLREAKIIDKASLEADLVDCDKKTIVLQENMNILNDPEGFLKREKTASILTTSLMIALEAFVGWLIATSLANYGAVILASDALFILVTLFFGAVDVKYVEKHVRGLQNNKNYSLATELDNLNTQRDLIIERIHELESEILRADADIRDLKNLSERISASINKLNVERNAVLSSVPWVLSDSEIDASFDQSKTVKDVIVRERKLNSDGQNI